MNAFQHKLRFIDKPNLCVMNYECFGWWLPDLLSDTAQPPRISKHNGNVDECESGVCLQRSQLVSKESSTFGSQLDRTDVNQRTIDSEESRINNNNNIMRGSPQRKKKNMVAVAPLTVARSGIRNRRSNVTLKKMKTIEDSSPSRQQLATLINPNSPNHKQLEAVLNLGSQTRNELTKSERQFKTSTPLNRRKKCLSDSKTSLQQEHSISQVDSVRHGLSHFVELALSIEHDSDRELEKPRGKFLQAITVLDSRIRVMQAESRQFHTDLKTLQEDFQSKESDVMRMTEEAQRLGADIQDTRYLDDLIFLLQGQLDRITLRRWPFLLANVLPHTDSSQELNLVV